MARNDIRESMTLTMCLALCLFLTGLIQAMLLPFLLSSSFHLCRGLVADLYMFISRVAVCPLSGFSGQEEGKS